jgi:hypothetical protein
MIKCITIMNLHTDILTIVYHYCDDPTKFKLRLLSKETYGTLN